MLTGKHPLTLYREREGLGVREFARLLGVSSAAVSRWESGKRSPEPAYVRSISQKTGIPPLELRPDLVEPQRVDTSNPPFACPAPGEGDPAHGDAVNGEPTK